MGRGFQYISEALDLERFTVFTLSPTRQRFELLVEYVRTTVRDGVPLKDDPVVRQRLAQLATQLEVARVLGLKFVFESSKGGAAPTAEASEYKLFATELSKRLADASMDIAGPGSQLRVKTTERPGGAGGVDLPLHRHRHHRRRGLGDPEEHHRPAQARSAGRTSEVDVDGASPGGPLEGITVLDFSTVGPAARCTRLLADYGALVIKVGPVPSADATPIVPQYFAYSGHRGMRRVLADLKDDDGREAFLALAAVADVVVESFRPGVVDRLGVGFDPVSARNPGVVYCSTSGYGRSGPAAQWAGHDIDYLAVGGYLAMSTPGVGHAAVPGRDGGRRCGGRHAGGAGHHRRAGGAGKDGAGPLSGRGRGGGRAVVDVAGRR